MCRTDGQVDLSLSEQRSHDEEGSFLYDPSRRASVRESGHWRGGYYVGGLRVQTKPVIDDDYFASPNRKPRLPNAAPHSTRLISRQSCFFRRPNDLLAANAANAPATRNSVPGSGTGCANS